MLFDWDPLFSELEQRGAGSWVDQLRPRCRQSVDDRNHGTLREWIDVVEQLPSLPPAALSIRDGHVTLSLPDSEALISEPLRQQLVAQLRRYHPWRKGPFDLFGIRINTEWRSDRKWDRLASHLSLQDHLVLDVGCGNGYYGWRMLQAGARMVCGLDPFLLYVMQHEVIRHFLPVASPNFVLPVGDDVLPDRLRLFDTVFSMGVLYHRTSPIDHLQSLAAVLRPGGTLVLESLILEGDRPSVLVPESRYAKMRNVWFIPSVPMLLRWLQRTGFRDGRVLDVSTTTIDEQRRTDWMTFESLSDFLDPADHHRTIEGDPAPVRAIVMARLG